MFKIIGRKKYKALLNEIEELKEPITFEAQEHIDKLCLIPLLEEGRVKRNLAIKLMRQIYRQIYKDESIIQYHMFSDKLDMAFARIKCVKFK